ncbi:MAG: glycerophosphodiester phosphodiesterase [Pseudobdellovibrio sp.]
MIWTEDKNIWNWLPKLQAHRGFCVAGLQQNSLAAIQAAFEQKYQISEFDVRMTADSQVILFHDDRFENNIIAKTDFATLNKLTPVTPLEELFKWLVTIANFKLNIEIKSREIVNAQLERKVCELIRQYKVEDRVLVSSFNPLTLYRVRRYSPKVYRALLLTFERDHGNNFVIKSRVMNYLCRPHMLNLRYNDYSKRFKKLAQKIPVVLWTVNDVSIFKKHSAEVHGIISDKITPEDLKNN